MPLILYRVCPSELRVQAARHLDRVHTHCRSHTVDNLESHVFGLQEESRVLSGNLKSWEKIHASKLHAHRAEVGIETPTLKV